MTEKSNSGVNCGNVSALEKIEDEIFSSVSNVIDKNNAWTDAEKEKVREHFKEAFSSAFHEYIFLNSKPWSSAPEGCVKREDNMEPPDQEKIKYLNQVIYPNVNSLLVETTKLRRHLPNKSAQEYHRKCHFECQLLDKVEVNLPVDSLIENEDLCGEDLISDTATVAFITKKIIEDFPAKEKSASDIIAMSDEQVDHVGEILVGSSSSV